MTEEELAAARKNNLEYFREQVDMTVDDFFPTLFGRMTSDERDSLAEAAAHLTALTFEYTPHMLRLVALLSLKALFTSGMQRVKEEGANAVLEDIALTAGDLTEETFDLLREAEGLMRKIRGV